MIIVSKQVPAQAYVLSDLGWIQTSCIFFSEEVVTSKELNRDKPKPAKTLII